jgi:hypothetical protein
MPRKSYPGPHQEPASSPTASRHGARPRRCRGSSLQSAVAGARGPRLVGGWQAAATRAHGWRLNAAQGGHGAAVRRVQLDVQLDFTMVARNHHDGGSCPKLPAQQHGLRLRHLHYQDHLDEQERHRGQPVNLTHGSLTGWPLRRPIGRAVGGMDAARRRPARAIPAHPSKSLVAAGGGRGGARPASAGCRVRGRWRSAAAAIPACSGQVAARRPSPPPGQALPPEQWG